MDQPLKGPDYITLGKEEAGQDICRPWYAGGMRNAISSFIDVCKNSYRAVMVLLATLLWIAFLYWSSQWWWHDLTNDTAILKAFAPLLTIIFAAPVAYLIWSFRNADKRQDIKNARIAAENSRIAALTNDFHEIEKWATGVGVGVEKATELRVAAIHQLRPYLNGDHGVKFFRRPAYEIYRAVLRENWTKTDEPNQVAPYYIHAIHEVINEECSEPGAWHKVFVQELGMDLRYLNLRFANLQKVCFDGANLSNVNMQGTYLDSSHLQEANLSFANLSGANLREANLQGADLSKAILQGATLMGTDLRKANLRLVSLQDAILLGANLEGANLTEADLKGANLINANLLNTIFDGTTYSKSTKWPDDFNPLEHDGLIPIGD